MISRRIQATVDQLLMENGHYAPIELLLALGRLPYGRYEAWRCGDDPYIDELLAGSHPRIVNELREAESWCQRLGMTSTVEEHSGWGKNAGKPLACSRSPGIDTLLRTHYTRTTNNEPQLDLFMDTTTTVTLNGLKDALAARDRQLAEALLADFLRAAPDHRQGQDMAQLVDALAYLSAEKPPPDPPTMLSFMQQQLAPSALALLGNRARDFLAPFWRHSGDLLATLPFEPRHPDRHASTAYEQCMDWQAVHDTIVAVELSPLPALLMERLARARHWLGLRADAIATWCHLCWQWPDEASAHLWNGKFPDNRIQRRWESFQDLDFAPEADWFPAWLLIQEPGLRRILPENLAPETTTSGRTFHVLWNLLEQQRVATDPAEIRLRETLLAVSGEFLQIYLQRRSSGPS